MTFADLFTTLTTRGVLPRAKDCKTALLLLAHALGSPSLEACQVDAACRQEATWGKALDTHFAHLQTTGRTLSGPNRRNIRSNLRTVFKVAEAHGLLQVSLPPRLLTKPTRRDFDPPVPRDRAVRLDLSSHRAPPAASACASPSGRPISRKAGGSTGPGATTASARRRLRAMRVCLGGLFRLHRAHRRPHAYLGGPL